MPTPLELVFRQTMWYLCKWMPGRIVDRHAGYGEIRIAAPAPGPPVNTNGDSTVRVCGHAIAFIVQTVLSAAVPLPALCVTWPCADATYRRELKVENGEAPLTATTTVFLDDRFTGFVLTDAQGAARPFSLLNRVGSQCAVFFDATPGETLYVYPTAHAALPPPGDAHKSGLLHQTRTYDGCEVKSVAQFETLWKDAPVQGGRFDEQIYAAFNPFGPNTSALHRYDGFLILKKSGTYQFCLASTDASFLLIDGREIVAWPAKHPVKEGLDCSKNQTATLTEGVHHLVFLHANSSEASYAIAAMALPGEKRYFVIAPQLFTRAAYAFVGPLLDRDGQRTADFIWENRYMVTMKDHGLYELTFEATPFREDPAAVYTWDFGDGAHAVGRTTNHLYFAQGEVPVTLTVTGGNGRKTVCRQTIRIVPRYGQNENDDAKALALLERAVAQEHDSVIQPQGYALITYGYFFFLKEEEAARFGQRVLAAVDRLPEADIGPVMTELAMGVQQVNEQYELAERCFKTILERGRDPAQRAVAALHYAGMLNLCLNRPEDACKLLDSIKREDLAGWEQRLLDIYRADTALVLDDVATAQKMYAAIPEQVPLIAESRVDRKTLFDYNSRYFRIQNLLIQGLYRESLPEVDTLEWEVPSERASPRMNLLKVKALAGNNQPRKAIVCLQRALLADIDETYTPKLRLELARLYAGMNQFIPAKYQIALIRKESPWTQEEIDARKLLEDIDRKIGEVRP